MGKEFSIRPRSPLFIEYIYIYIYVFAARVNMKLVSSVTKFGHAGSSAVQLHRHNCKKGRCKTPTGRNPVLYNWVPFRSVISMLSASNGTGMNTKLWQPG